MVRSMTSKEIFVGTMVIAVALIGLSLVNDKKAYMTRLFFRGIAGIFLIYLANTALVYVQIPLNLGVNLYSIGTASLLGIPGIALLYGIMSCKIL